MSKSFANKITLLLLLCLLASSLAAQRRLRTPEIYFGVQGGVTASTVTFNPSVDGMSPITNATRLGGNGGLVFRYSAQKCCALQVELNYLQRGWREHNDAIQYQRTLHYIELPFLMHIYFGSPVWRGFVNVGPEIGYCVLDDGGSGTPSTTSTYQYQPIDNRFDWGIAAGLGFYCRTRKAGLYQLEARFDFGFGTIYSHRAADHFRASNPMELSLNLAWLWEFKKSSEVDSSRRRKVAKGG